MNTVNTKFGRRAFAGATAFTFLGNFIGQLTGSNAGIGSSQAVAQTTPTPALGPAILTWESPYLVSRKNSPSANAAAINRAISDSGTADRTGTIVLPPGLIQINQSILVKPGTRLLGMGAQSYQVGGTELFLAPGSNCNVIQDTGWPNGAEWWHWGEIGHLRINGNKAANSVGSGIAIRQMGETAEIHQVLIKDCAEYAYRFSGLHAPFTVRNCSMFNSGKAGMLLGSRGCAVCTIDGLSGDNNNVFIRVEGSTALFLSSPKAEGAHDPFLDLALDDTNSQITIIGGYPNGYTARNDLIRISSGRPSITVVGMFQYQYKNLINDVPKRTTVASTSQSVGNVLYNATFRPLT